jgi:tetratricopeptide (TPR) repeat protein
MTAGYFTQALFNPESLGTRVLCYLAFALAIWLRRSPSAEPEPRVHSKPGPLALAVAEVAGIAIVTIWTILPAYASEMGRLTDAAYQQGRYVEAWRSARQGASVPTPYLDKQLLVSLRLLLRVAESSAPEYSMVWRDLLAVDRELAQRCFAYHRSPRLQMIYAVTLHSVAVGKRDDLLYKESEQELRNAMHDNPRRRDIAFALAAILTEHGRIDDAEHLYRKTVDDEPQIGESQFYLGRFLWIYRNKLTEGASYLARSPRSQCGYAGGDMGELALIATAFDRLGDRDGLAALVPAAENVRPSTLPQHYGVLAGYLERAGLSSERDSILRLGMKQFPELVEQSPQVSGAPARR